MKTKCLWTMFTKKRPFSCMSSKVCLKTACYGKWLQTVTLLNCEYRNCEYCFCDLTFANVAIVKYIPLKIANLAIVKYISINIANFLILYNLQLITQQMSSFMSFVINCVIYFAVYLWYLEHFVFIHCSDVGWTINKELVNNTIPNTIFFMPK